MLKNNYTRGAITGLGLVNVWAAVAELIDWFGQAKPRPPDNPQSPIRNQQS